MELEKFKEKVLAIAKDLSTTDDYGFEIFLCSYDESTLSDATLSDIFESSNPKYTFEEMLNDWAFDYQVDYGEDFLEESIKECLTDEEQEMFEENSDKIWDMLHDYIYFYYDEKQFNNDIQVNIMIDCGNGNYDYTMDNVLNWYGRHGNGEIPEESSMLWLAKTQRKATALRKACKHQQREDCYYVDREAEKDAFVESCIREFENLPSAMGTVTFLVKMKLFDLFDLIELQQKEYDENAKYDPRKNTKSKSYFVLDKSTMCGLYDPWNGSGSVLEIKLDKDVKVPIKYAEFCIDGCRMHGYDVENVYGLCRSCWQNTLKEIKEAA